MILGGEHTTCSGLAIVMGPPENPEKTFGIFLRLKFLDSMVLGEDRMAINKEKRWHLVPPRVSAENVGSKVCVE